MMADRANATRTGVSCEVKTQVLGLFHSNTNVNEISSILSPTGNIRNFKSFTFALPMVEPNSSPVPTSWLSSESFFEVNYGDLSSESNMTRPICITEAPMMILEFHTYIYIVYTAIFLTKKDIPQELCDCCLLIMASIMESLGAIVLISC
jgi:hypothetical protein